MKTQTVARIKIFTAITLLIALLIGTYYILPAKAAEAGVNYADVPSDWIFGAEGVWHISTGNPDLFQNNKQTILLSTSSEGGNNPTLEIHSRKIEIAPYDIIDFSTYIKAYNNTGYSAYLIIDLYSSNLTKLTNYDYITGYVPVDDNWNFCNLTITVPSTLINEIPKYAVLAIMKADYDVLPDFYFSDINCNITPYATQPEEGWGTTQFDLIAPYIPLLILTIVFCGVGVWQAGVWGLIAGLNTAIMLAYIFRTCSILFLIGIIIVDGLMLFGKFSASKKEAT